jgi:thioredoxin 1
MSKLKVMKFYADWCGPCKTLTPIFDEVSSEVENVDFQSINVDVDSETAARYGIKAIPTIVFEKDDKVVQKKMGILSKKQIVEFINENL